ncbi:MAG: phenylalanine--tRNA ligase beta subunit-related protein, partial [Gemmatimonadota bacterium]|nr:phenylalanine--tRNA ligase beta subunit-related protein [Gemmatimonadota bacterium]
MNVSLRWLESLLPGLDADASEVADRLSATAVVVEEVVSIGEGLEELLVARVQEARPHPNADRLTLCRVEAGGESPVDVVCGAPEVIEGALYPYVPPGATLPDGLEIEVRTIRGEESHGMLCSASELGLGRDASGIMRLDDGLEVGVPLTDALELPDARLVLDLTPNRVDLACHVGVAREIAPGGTAQIVLPRFGESWEPEWEVHESRAEAAGVSVEIEAPERCERYLGAVIHDVQVGPSPAWLQSRLRAIGARPVNNVVDATNYVLHEVNQPLHAFDLGRLQGRDVRVREARVGERLRTLDGVERELRPSMTVIADAEEPV